VLVVGDGEKEEALIPQANQRAPFGRRTSHLCYNGEVSKGVSAIITPLYILLPRVISREQLGAGKAMKLGRGVGSVDF
jgi:hypothetical protein